MRQIDAAIGVEGRFAPIGTHQQIEPVHIVR